MADCSREKDFGEIRSDIKLLNSHAADHKQELERLGLKVETFNTIQITVELMAQTLSQIEQHNARQDKEADRREALFVEQSKALQSINANLTELNGRHSSLHNKVDTLELRIDEAEQKHFVDLREIEKEGAEALLRRYGPAMATGGMLAALLLEIIRSIGCI